MMERILDCIAITLGVLVAVFATLWLCNTVRAQEPGTLGYCEARARLTLTILQGMEDGTPMDKLNIVFQQPAESEEAAKSREVWVQDLKDEIVAAMKAVTQKDERTQRIAQKIIETCWYNYGKERTLKKTAYIEARSYHAKAEFARRHPCPSTGERIPHCPGYVIDHVTPLCAGGLDSPSNMQWQNRAESYRKDARERAQCSHLHKAGSVQPPREVSIDPIAASSEQIGKHPRYDECSRILQDQVFIGNQLGSERATPDELRMLAMTSKQPLDPERLQKVLKLIDEADDAMKKQGVQAWFDGYWKSCLQ